MPTAEAARPTTADSKTPAHAAPATPSAPAPATPPATATAAAAQAPTAQQPIQAMFSDSIDQIAKALSAAQGMIQGASKNSENPHYGHNYADLASVWDACRDALSKNNLAVFQTTRRTTQGIVLVTRLVHSSGQWVQGELPINPVKNDPQGIGSCLTYMRRYSLAAMVGVAPEDDDGNAASGKPVTDRDREKYEARKAAQQKTIEERPASDSGERAAEDLSGEWVATFVPSAISVRKVQGGKKEWFSIKDPDGTIYDTDKKELAQVAKDAKEKSTAINVVYTKKKYKDKIDRLVVRVEVDGAQPEPAGAEENPA